MNRSRRERLERLFVAAQELDPAARDDVLARECRDDAALREEIEALIASASKSEDYFAELSRRIGVAPLFEGTALGGLLSKAGALETGNIPVQSPQAHASDNPSFEGTERELIAGAYRLVRELGSGGMASVWLAYRSDGLIQRPVALKLAHGAWRRAALVERMAREREILAALTHPNIARLYDAGLTEDGQPYLALEYVEGVPIDRYCRAGELGVRDRLRLFTQVAAAVAYAHAQLVVHRDIKPSNVLVTNDGDVKLLDFGIAKLLAGGEVKETKLTQAAGRALTVDYASPEQILGRSLTIASDVYSLGVLLYEVLTGVRPYRLSRESPAALEEAILIADAQRPSDVASPDLRRALRGDIDTIALKALKKDPLERYATVNALIDDIDRYLKSLPVLARPDGAWYRASRFVLRNRVSVAAAGLVLFATVSGAVAALLQARTADAERLRAEEINAFVTSIFERTNPYQEAGTILDAAQLLRRAREDLEGRFLDRPDRRIELLSIVGSSLISQGDLPGAEDALQEALAEAQRTHGGDHVLALQARTLLTEIQSIRRDSGSVREELETLLPDARAHVAERPEILVRALKLQADLAFEEGRYTEVAAPVREATELARRRLKHGDPLTSAVSALLAEALVMYTESVADMLDETDSALADVLAAHPNPDHPQVLRIREIRVRALAVAGLFRESVDEAHSVIDAFSRIFGAESLQAVSARANIAPYERRLGQIDQSLRHSDAVLQTLGQTIEHESADYAYLLVTRGATLIAARRAEAALDDLATSETTYAEVVGDRHWNTVTARLHRAVALAYLGRFAEADDALAITRDTGMVPQVPWWSAHIDGIVARLAGNPAAAIVAQREAERLIAPGPRADWDRVRALPERGLAELADGRAREARSTLSEAQALFVRLGIRMHPAYAETLAGLGALLIEAEPNEALPLLEQANDFWLSDDPGNPAGGEAAFWLGRCYLAMNRDAEASSSFARARQLLGRSMLPRDARLSELIRETR